MGFNEVIGLRLMMMHDLALDILDLLSTLKIAVINYHPNFNPICDDMFQNAKVTLS